MLHLYVSNLWRVFSKCSFQWHSAYFHSTLYPSFRRKNPHRIFRKLPVDNFPHSAVRIPQNTPSQYGFSSYRCLHLFTHHCKTTTTHHYRSIANAMWLKPARTVQAPYLVRLSQSRCQLVGCDIIFNILMQTKWSHIRVGPSTKICTRIVYTVVMKGCKFLGLCLQKKGCSNFLGVKV